MLPHVESRDVAASVDKLLAEQGSALLSMKALIAAVREQTGTERSDADLAGLITKKAALLGVAVLSDLGGPDSGRPDSGRPDSGRPDLGRSPQDAGRKFS
ncbi:hypothetical protein [Mesorhizobium sp.]|uniref:hypothetical protein n=1 Tax=Mesorhizobium sp. TaxID=1871066 RepID=UPI00257E22D7|nr:hypothetical protein [Mesorhizobium sp.]